MATFLPIVFSTNYLSFIFIVTWQCLYFILGFNCIFSLFSLVFRVLEIISGRFIVFKLLSDLSFIGWFLFSFFFLIPHIYNDLICFPRIFFKIILDISREVKFGNYRFKKCPNLLTTTMVFCNNRF